MTPHRNVDYRQVLEPVMVTKSKIITLICYTVKRAPFWFSLCMYILTQWFTMLLPILLFGSTYTRVVN